MSKYLWHFDVHYVEMWDNTYLDILTEKEKEILEYLWKCKNFWKYFNNIDFDNPPKTLYFKEISNEEADVILKYINYCKSYFEYILDWIHDLYHDKFGKWFEGDFTLEQVKQLVNDSNS